jgi:hypothetical protein
MDLVGHKVCWRITVRCCEWGDVHIGKLSVADRAAPEIGKRYRAGADPDTRSSGVNARAVQQMCREEVEPEHECETERGRVPLFQREHAHAGQTPLRPEQKGRHLDAALTAGGEITFSDVGLILEGNRFANVKGRAVVVSNSAFDFNDGLFIVDNIISGTTDSALYLALRYDGLTITGNRIDGVGIDGSNPQKAAAIYITHGSTFGGLTTVGYSANYIMASPAVNGNTFLQYGILFDAIGGPPVMDMSNSYSNIQTNCGSINSAVTCTTAVPSLVSGNTTQLYPIGYCSTVGGTPQPSPQFMGSSAAMQCISVGGTPMAAVRGPRGRRRLRFAAL